MIASLIALLGSLFDQFSATVIKKVEIVKDRAVSIWDVALISLASSSVFIFVAGSSFKNVNFEEIFTGMFFLRIILEMIQIYATYNALKYAQLSSFNFVRGFSVVFTVILEIILLGTVFSGLKYLGVMLVVVSIAVVFRHGLTEVKGWVFLAVSAISGGVLNAIAKYQYVNLEAYVVESWVRIVLIALLIVISLINNLKMKSNIFSNFKLNKNWWLLIPFKALASILGVVALNMGSAAVYVTVERGGSVLFGVLLGRVIFKEKSLVEKLLISLGIITGIGLVSFG